MFNTLSSLVHALGRRTSTCFRIVFADGSVYQNRDGEPAFAVRFKSAAAQTRVVLTGYTGLLESYFGGGIDIDGDLGAAFRAGLESGFDAAPGLPVWLRNQWQELARSNRTLAGAKANARAHYGLGAEFFGCWLDEPQLVYSCGYWGEGTRTLEQAQRDKLDYVCRKIRLQAGESVVDVGCGFGGFLFHAAEHCGAAATGIDTVTEQVRWLREEVGRRLLADRIAVREADFREPCGSFDKLVSIELLEHAGRDQLEEAIRAHARLLKPGGLGLLQFVGHVGAGDTEFLLRRHVFPGAWIPGLAETLAALDQAGLEVLDVENLRRHCAPTLDAWAERFERRWEEIRRLDSKRFDERFRRVWRSYLHASAEAFRAPGGRTHLFQVVVAKGSPEGYPMSRSFLYGPRG
ncbi:MAG TPA: cyclopropane-fatty-acyl-phospholipid synthase family protein [Rhodocyclaceae bacterium]|nr:cyclopropane-fatty-acyl-phospholipid synthase family protein [Rhodocyclaceae bacterium]